MLGSQHHPRMRAQEGVQVGGVVAAAQGQQESLVVPAEHALLQLSVGPLDGDAVGAVLAQYALPQGVVAIQDNHFEAMLLSGQKEPSDLRRHGVHTLVAEGHVSHGVFVGVVDLGNAIAIAGAGEIQDARIAVSLDLFAPALVEPLQLDCEVGVGRPLGRQKRHPQRGLAIGPRSQGPHQIGEARLQDVETRAQFRGSQIAQPVREAHQDQVGTCVAPEGAAGIEQFLHHLVVGRHLDGEGHVEGAGPGGERFCQRLSREGRGHHQSLGGRCLGSAGTQLQVRLSNNGRELLLEFPHQPLC